MKRAKLIITTIFCFLAVATVFAGQKKQRLVDVDYSLDVAQVWSGHPVDFYLMTQGNHQYVAYYDRNGQMTVSSRTLDVKEWKSFQIPNIPKLGNSIFHSVVMGIDADGYLHLSGNMHGDPIIYFKSTKPHDIYSLERLQGQVGWWEAECTYPQFMKGAEGELVFRYRSVEQLNKNLPDKEPLKITERRGWCSSEVYEFYNVYTLKTKAWRKLIDPYTPFFDAQHSRKSYLELGFDETRGTESIKGMENRKVLYSVISGADDFYHMVWVWQDDSDCNTFHDVGYARSKKQPVGLYFWETMTGKMINENPYKKTALWHRYIGLPLTFDTENIIVDHVPVNGGLINSNTMIGFDKKNRPIISYTKFDENGKTQVYNSRFEKNQWKSYQTSDWNYRWQLEGAGSENNEIQIDPVEVTTNGLLIQSYRHVKYGPGTWQLDEKTLKPVGEIEMPPWPAELGNLQDKRKNMQVNWRMDDGETSEVNSQYVLLWETLAATVDSPDTPAPSVLKLVKLKYQWK